MGVVLYDFPQSGNAQKVRYLLAELGLEFGHRHVPHTRPRPDWYLQLNPFGGVPFVVDGETQLAESQAILRHLALRERRDDLYPAAPERRARVDWALDAWTTYVGARLGPLFLAAIAGTRDADGNAHPESADPERMAAAMPSAREGLAAFERFCAEDGSVCGSGFTIADCAVGPLLPRLQRLGLDLGREFPRLARVHAAVTGRPAFAAAHLAG
jgi:glutathione S-transferase